MAETKGIRRVGSGLKGLSYGALVVLALAAGAVIGNRWTSTEAAAWVQAIGSIVAILGAFAVALFQGKQQIQLLQDEKYLDELEASRLVVALAEDAIYAIRDASKAIAAHKGGGEPFSAETDRLERSEAGMLAILPTRVPARMVFDVIVFQRLLTYSLRALRQRQGSSADFTTRTRGSAEARLSEALKRLESLRRLLSEFEKQGKPPALR